MLFSLFHCYHHHHNSILTGTLHLPVDLPVLAGFARARIKPWYLGCSCWCWLHSKIFYKLSVIPSSMHPFWLLPFCFLVSVCYNYKTTTTSYKEGGDFRFRFSGATKKLPKAKVLPLLISLSLSSYYVVTMNLFLLPLFFVSCDE